MNLLGDRDLFELWRLALGVICCVYALVVTVRSLWAWVLYLSGSDRHTTLLRNLLVVHLLRLSGRRFARDLTQIGLLLVALVALMYWHDFQ